MTKREKVLSLLEKLQRLADASRNNSQEEAEAAAARMQALMTEHHISEAEIQDTDGEEPDPVIHRTLMKELGMKTKLITWKRILLNGLAQANNCHIVSSPAYNTGRGMLPGRVHIFGKQPDIDLVVYMFQYLSREVERLCSITQRAHSFYTSGEKRSWGNSFRFGAAQTLYHRLMEAHRATLGQCAAQTQALVHKASQDAAMAAKSHFNGNLKQTTSSCRANEGYGRGLAAGRGIHLGGQNRALGGGRKQLKG